MTRRSWFESSLQAVFGTVVEINCQSTIREIKTLQLSMQLPRTSMPTNTYVQYNPSFDISYYYSHQLHPRKPYRLCTQHAALTYNKELGDNLLEVRKLGDD
jgi:hypothetical protein